MVFCFSVLACLNVFAYSSAEFAEAMDILAQQSEKLQNQSLSKCPQDYKKINSVKNIKISIFNGYENEKDKTFDQLHATALARTLQQKCKGSMAACEFKLTHRSQQAFHLSKNRDGKSINLKIVYTSLTENDNYNLHPDKGFWAQDAIIQKIRAEFYQDLQFADVVIYSGHSRGGGGVGLNIYTPALAVFDLIFKGPKQEMMLALQQRPSRLKMLLLNACRSEEYYRSGIESANPNTSLLLTRGDIFNDEGEQIQLGFIDALVGQKCKKDFNEALIGEADRSRRIIKYLPR